MTTAFWRRIDTPGHDHARLERADDGWVLSGVALFVHAGAPARLDYRVDLAADWTTRAGRVESRIGGGASVVRAIERTEGAWVLDGRPQPGLDDLVHLDLGFSPSTNLQQLRRADLQIGDNADIPAAWLDVEGGLSRMDQTYRRTGEHTYAYEAPKADYTAELRVGADGFVDDYPGLWVRERGEKT